MSQEELTLRDGRIVRSESPLNLEMPFSSGDSFITPTKSFYVRTHFPIPVIDRNAWWLYVEGEVEKPFAINYQELITLQSATAPVTLECAGNNRNFLEPKVKGVQWRLGAVGNAVWTGVALSVLLDRAILKPSACEVVLEGTDGGILEDPKSPPGELKFARSLPLEKARRDVLLAYKMNGEDLPAEHGFPVRAIVLGWYAMALVDILDVIPPEKTALRAPLLAMIPELADSLVRHQDATGAWFQIMDLPGEPGNYREASASAMFTYFLAKAVNQGYLPKSFASAAEKAYRGLIDEFVSVHADGSFHLTNVCETGGLGYGRDGSYRYYMSERVVENDPKGLGPAIMAGIQVTELSKR